jgi:hypothetical protein
LSVKRLSESALAVVATFFLVAGTAAQTPEQGWQRHRLRHHHTRGEYYYTPEEYARGIAGYWGPYRYVFVPLLAANSASDV